MLLSLATLRPAIGAGILPNRSGAWLSQLDQTIPRTRLIDAMRSDRFRSALLPPVRACLPAGCRRPRASASRGKRAAPDGDYGPQIGTQAARSPAKRQSSAAPPVRI